MKKIAENDKAIFYNNMMTKDYGDGYKIVLAEQKSNGYKEYLLINGENVMCHSQNIETIWAKKDAIDLMEKLK